MIRAAIDMGSNSTLFLVVRKDDKGQWRLLEENLIPNGLGWEMTAAEGLSEDVQNWNMDILRSLKSRAESNGVEEIRVVGTAALRTAPNSDKFLKKVLDGIGLEIQLISGEEEARLTYIGAMLDFPDLPGPVQVVDVGGGSSELVLGIGQEIQEAVSLPVGAVSLTKSLITSQPLSSDDIKRIEGFVEEELQQLPESVKSAAGSVIAVGGTASTLAAMTLGIDVSRLWKYDPVPVSVSAVEEFWQRFAGMAVPDIADLPYMPPDRAGIIAGGTVILLQILCYLKTEKAILSSKGLRWGLVVDDNFR
jgi:exopolyphosphatase/guanosine-5'-triphosphate,3'-diphosphate pyrophosphatase